MEASEDYVDVAVTEWQDLHSEADLTAFAICRRLIRGGRILDALVEPLALASGFDVGGDYEVLATLRRSQPTPLQPAQLAERVMVTTSGMTGRLDRLEAAGMIERKNHPEDRRALIVEITPLGVETADTLFRAIVEEESALLSGISERDRDQLNSLLRALLLQIGDKP
jgi:DNA-binding MarR family transcriptional regulator